MRRLGRCRPRRPGGVHERRGQGRPSGAEGDVAQRIRRLLAHEPVDAPLLHRVRHAGARPRLVRAARRSAGSPTRARRSSACPRSTATSTWSSAIFLANAGNVGHLHFDGDQRDVILHQVYGRKRVVLFPPAAAKHLRTLDGPYSRPSLAGALPGGHEPRGEARLGRARGRLPHGARARGDDLHPDADVAPPRVHGRRDVVQLPLRPDAGTAASSRSTTSTAIPYIQNVAAKMVGPRTSCATSSRSSTRSSPPTSSRPPTSGTRCGTCGRCSGGSARDISPEARSGGALPAGSRGGAGHADRRGQRHEGRPQVRGSRPLIARTRAHRRDRRRGRRRWSERREPCRLLGRGRCGRSSRNRARQGRRRRADQGRGGAAGRLSRDVPARPGSPAR